MNKEFPDLLAAPDETVEAAAVHALSAADERLLERVDQAIHMRYFGCLERNDNQARDRLFELLRRIVLSKPGRKLYPDAATRRLVQWEHIHTLLDVHRNDRSPLEEAKDFLSTSKHGKRIIEELRRSPLHKEQLLEMTGTSESSLSQTLSKMEVRGLLRRKSDGRKVVVSLGLIGIEVARDFNDQRSPRSLMCPKQQNAA